ncbi:hypothetical protein V6C53_01150 [Desulfocurvibacter africanus]|uniref:hypothetical protein n=1 Tax=Desulfocurvibacter africanus TaxID=873 RepID=UPI002FD9B27F
MKDGRTRLAYKSEHTVDLDKGAIVAAKGHPADQGDTKTLGGTLVKTKASLSRSTQIPPRPDDPAELVADKGYHSREVLKNLEDGPFRSRISEPKRQGLPCWHGDKEARREVYT